MINKVLIAFIGFVLPFSKLVSEDTLMDQEIKHVVIVMLENRSFDNVLGWLYEKDSPLKFIPEGIDPNFKGLSEDTLELYTNELRNADGELVFSCPPIKGTPSIIGTNAINSPQFNPNEPFPNVTNQIFGFDGGTTPNMLGFLQDYATLFDPKYWLQEKKIICSVMETYTEKEMPVLYGLAKHYAVSDEWFSSVPTQTNPNRAFFMCGTSDGQTVNGKYGLSQFNSDTLWNRLSEEAPNATWGIFWQSDMVEGIIEKPASGPKTFLNLALIPNIETHIFKIDEFHKLARKGQLPSISFLEPQWTLAENISPSNPQLINEDILFGLQGNDLHPPGDIRSGENFIANIYTSLIANPEAWNQTLFIITFDEHGGLFDHVPPPAAVSPDNQAQEGFKFDRYGVRVPTIFISPKVNKKTVIRSKKPEVPFDHTSFMATMFKWQHIEKKRWNMGNRTRKAPTFESVITLTQPRRDSVIVSDEIILPQANPENVVRMEKPFYLKDKTGAYVLQSQDKQVPDVAEFGDKAVMRFGSGSGKITHGSFVLIESSNLADCTHYILEAHPYGHDCCFNEDMHNSSQWWTVKSVDHPYLGYEIQYGDKIYLENHVYTDFINYAPARLAKKEGWLGDYLSTKSVIKDCDECDYWILEKYKS